MESIAIQLRKLIDISIPIGCLERSQDEPSYHVDIRMRKARARYNPY